MSWSGNRKGQEDFIMSKEKFRNPILVFYLNQKATFCTFSRKLILKVNNKRRLSIFLKIC